MANKEKLLETAQKFLQKNQLSKAIKQYEKILGLDEKDFRSRQRLAELYSRKGEVDKALAHYEKVAAYYAEHAFYLKVIAVYKQMQRLAPENTSFTLKLAKFNERQGLTGNALAEYRTLLRHYEASADLNGAIESLGRIRHLDPDNVNAAVKQADYLARSGEAEDARLVFYEVEKRLRQKGNHKHLEMFYQHFMELWPDNVDVQVGFGRAMLDFSSPETALEYLGGLNHQYPENGVVLDLLAAGLHRCGEFDRERECLRKWAKLEPENIDSRLRLFEALLEAGEAEACFLTLEEAKERFFTDERVDEIKPFYERLHKMLPDNRDVVKSLRTIYEHLGEGEKLFDAFSLNDEAAFGAEPLAHSSGSDSDGAHSSAEVAESLPAAGEDSSDSDFNNINFDDIVFDTMDDDQGPLDFDMDDVLSAEDTPSTHSSAVRPRIDVSAILEEIDFYMQQGLLDEALEGCQRLSIQVPDSSEVKQRLEKIERFRSRQRAPLAGIAPDDASLHQTATPDADELQQSFSSEQVSPSGQSPFQEEEPLLGLKQSLQGGFDLDIEVPELADSQLGIETEIEEEDTESAYNLGIAYMEMGLNSDAVLQFIKAKKDPARKVASISMQARCYQSMQQYDKAEEALTYGLSAADLSMDERIALYYETGLLYEECDRHADALASYQVVEDKDPEFREVRKKVAALRLMIGVADSNDDLHRVSYV
ncbi:MAG: tetratricopeptide repeat protein [Desulfuromonadaceae bacterium]|nr:tetratricopeptide repeat protein [Desulfuromonadaceae bacterium]